MQNPISDELFEEMVNDGIDSLDQKYVKKLKNVAIVTADYPTQEQMRKGGVRQNGLLLGLYEGIPQTARGNNYSGVIPDKISIFKVPIMILSRDLDHMREQVKNTVWHEVAHHYGLGHGRIHELEGRA